MSAVHGSLYLEQAPANVVISHIIFVVLPDLNKTYIIFVVIYALRRRRTAVRLLVITLYNTYLHIQRDLLKSAQSAFQYTSIIRKRRRCFKPNNFNRLNMIVFVYNTANNGEYLISWSVIGCFNTSIKHASIINK